MGFYIPACMITMMDKLMNDCKYKVPLMTELNWHFVPMANPDGYYYTTVSYGKVNVKA